MPDRDLETSVLVHFNYRGSSLDGIWRENQIQGMKWAYPKAEVFHQQKQVEQPPRLHKRFPDKLIELDIGALDFWLCPFL